MTNKELKDIIHEIQKKEKATIIDIVDKADLNRSNFSVFLNSKVEKVVSDNMLYKLTKAYPDYFGSNISNIGSKQKDLTMQALVNLTESNKKLANALNTMADSHKVTANSHAELVMMVKQKNGFTEGVHSQTAEETTALVLALRELLTDVSAQVFGKPRADVESSLNKMVTVARGNLSQTDM